MVTKKDIFIVHVTDDLIIRAVQYAEKSLQYTFNRMGLANHYDRVRNIVSGLVMEGAFKRLLDYHNVKYELLGNTHWTKKDRYDVGIDSHRYDVKGFFIKDMDNIKAIEKDRTWFLDCSALVPADQVAARSLKDDDVYVFPFMTGRVIRDISDIYSLFSEGQQKYLIHTFWDYEWFKNPEWRTLGQLIVESKMHEKIRIRIGGQGDDKEFIVEKIALVPAQKTTTNKEFYTVLFVQTADTPSGALTVESVDINKTEIVERGEWGNIWVYDALVYITGYIRKGEFKDKSEEIPRFYKECKQYAETKTVNRTLYVKELHSITDILPEQYEIFVP